MNKKIFLLCLFCILGINLVIAVENVSPTCNLDITLVNQDPYPAMPDAYVDIVFQVSGLQDPRCNGAKMELIPSYPFSLDNNDGYRSIKGTTFTKDAKNEWLVPYKLRVNKDALDGPTDIKVGYAPGYSDEYITKVFNITVQDSRTNFDAVIQENTGSEVSIALANTGKFTANSVIVKIPEQESFKATGTDGQMVGNLESGDYTIVSFAVSPKGRGGILKFDIYYTDNIGERRIINMELPMSVNSNALSMQRFGATAVGKTTTSSWSSWYTYIIILVVLIGIYVAYKKKWFRKIKSDSMTKNAPDWVKNSKDKEKK